MDQDAGYMAPREWIPVTVAFSTLLLEVMCRKG